MSDKLATLEERNIKAMTSLEKKYDNRIIRTLIRLIPHGIGSSIDMNIMRTIETIRHERMITFFDELGNGNIELTDEQINSRDFLHCYFNTIKAALLTRRKEKIVFLARLLKKQISNKTTHNLDNYEYYLSILDDLCLKEIEILMILLKYEKNNPTKTDRIQSRLAANNLIWKEFKEELDSKLDIKEEEVEATMLRIERTGCLYYSRTVQNSYIPYSGITTHLFRNLVKLIED